MQDLEKYDKIIAKQYKVSDKNLKNELGRFEIDKDIKIVVVSAIFLLLVGFGLYKLFEYCAQPPKFDWWFV